MGASRRICFREGLAKSSGWLLATLALVFGLAPPVGATGAGGMEGTFEYVIDVPWRLEPVPISGGGFDYGPVPIVITIHDALDVDLDDAYPGTPAPRIPEKLSLGNVCRLTVTNGNRRRHYEFGDLDEVELSRERWPFPDNGSTPQHELCRAWQGEDCSPLQDISETSEWHGLKWHRITQQNNGEPVAPGAIVDLELEVQLTRYPTVSCEEAANSQEELPAMLSLKNLVRVRFGESPLPRFGDGWVYGDLH